MRNVGLILVIAIAACGGKNQGTAGGNTMATQGPTLYDRLGKKDAIVAVVDDFVANVAADARINARFKNADIPKLKANLVDQICEASGGPCKYQGKDMKTAHTGMGIKDDEFGDLVDDLKKSLDKFKVGPKEQEELLGALGGMKKDVVGM
jgi:hemoglobin